MHNVIVLEDVVDETTQNEIYDSIFSKTTAWTFSRTVFYDYHPEVTKHQKSSLMSFTKPLIDFKTEERDELFPICYKPLVQGVEKLGGKVKDLYNARVQLQLPILTEKDKLFGVPHIDNHHLPNKYYIAVYYVNDVDGDTVLFKQTKNTATPEDIINGKLEIDQVISPKKGRMIIFDGDIYHAVGKPKTDLRCVLNFNFTYEVK